MARYGPKTALVVVDVQNDFASPDGSLYVSGGERVVERANEEIERAAAADSPIFYTQDWHPPSTPHFEKDGGIWPVHCVAETPGAQFHPRLKVEGEVVRKGTGGEDGYSGFTVRDPRSGEESDTPLEALLRDRGIEKIVVVGLATDYCVRETALDAVTKRFDVTVLEEAVAAVDREAGDGERALEEIRRAGGRVE